MWPGRRSKMNPAPPVTKTLIAMPSLSLRSYYTSRSLASTQLNRDVLPHPSPELV